MGVPGFFLWLLKKYNKNKNFIFEKKDNLSLSFDNLLLDTNCLIHPICNKVLSENENIHDIKVLELKMINEVIKYIEFIINFINPKKTIYIAIDGVVPIAKIKQQRLRRYKSMADKELWNNIKKKHNIPLSNNWNTNAITPGTVFMDKLHKYIINWAKNYNKKIIYSSYLTPGEGEHKLLNYIKNNINDTHLIYGLDADLFFLALSSGVSNIYLLRESTEINKYENNNEIFKFINIDIMKELIFITFNEFLLKENDNLKINTIYKNNIINDFIFICYMIGNDFLPHIICLDIHNNGVEYLLTNYIKTYLFLFIQNNKDFFIINKKRNKIKINDSFFKLFIYNLSLNENNILQHNFNNKKFIKFYTNKTDNIEYEKEKFKIENLQFKINDTILLGSDTLEDSRIRYYKHYWNLEDSQIEKFSKELVIDYLIGLKWITLYYFDNCPSWEWYYPYEYPPFIYDIYKYIDSINLNNISFNLGNIITPIQQLLFVLPPQSNYLLPHNIKHLIFEKNINHLYPNKIYQDFINKKKHWMAIPILPQLNINLINNLYINIENNINNIDKQRNITKAIYLFNT